MHSLLKHHFWVVYAAAVIICSALTAQAANHVVAATYLAVGAKPELRARSGRRSSAREQTRSKSGAPLAARNMFCSSCAPPEPEEEHVAATSPDGTPPETDLPLRLIATTVAPEPTRSMAIVENTETDASGAFLRGDPIPGAGPLVAIAGDYVDFEKRAGGPVQRLPITREEKPKKKRKITHKRTRHPHRPRSKRAKLVAEIEEGVKKTGDNEYEIERDVVNKVLANPRVLHGARIRPWTKDGKMAGFRVWRVTSRSPLRKVGVRNGDVLQAVNGMALTSPDKALEAYTKVRGASSIRISLLRHGKPTTLRFHIH